MEPNILDLSLSFFLSPYIQCRKILFLLPSNIRIIKSVLNNSPTTLVQASVLYHFLTNIYLIPSSPHMSQQSDPFKSCQILLSSPSSLCFNLNVLMSFICTILFNIITFSTRSMTSLLYPILLLLNIF